MVISAKIDKKTVDKIIAKYKKYELSNESEFVTFFAKIKNSTLTIYKKKDKEQYKVVISGSSEKEIKVISKELSLKDIKEDKTNAKKNVEAHEFIYLEDQIGSDEVGTGDFFGPVIVVASLVKKSDLKLLKELGVMDSKKLDDNKIRYIAKRAINLFPYSSLTLDNKKYNELIAKGYNINQIKVLLHNEALHNLHVKYPKIKHIYVDEFTSPINYYGYLKDSKNVEKKIFFHTKGETYFPSVALASVIARFSFLNKIDKLNKKYHVEIPLGASKQVDEFAKKFVKKYGIKEFDKIVKKHFKNYQRVIS